MGCRRGRGISLLLTAGPVPPRVHAAAKAGMLDHAVGHGWSARGHGELRLGADRTESSAMHRFRERQACVVSVCHYGRYLLGGAGRDRVCLRVTRWRRRWQE